MSRRQDAETLRIDGVIEARVTRRRRLAVVWDWAAALCSLLPSTPDTERGRATRDQLRWVGRALCALAMFLSMRGDPALFVVAALGLLVAQVVPMLRPDQQRLVQALRRRQVVEVDAPIDAALAHDGRRLELWRGEELVRRVLTQHPFSLHRAALGERVVWLVAPRDSKKKRDRIAVVLRDAAPEDGLEVISPDALDQPVVLTSAAWAPLYERLSRASQA